MQDARCEQDGQVLIVPSRIETRRRSAVKFLTQQSEDFISVRLVCNRYIDRKPEREGVGIGERIHASKHLGKFRR